MKRWARWASLGLVLVLAVIVSRLVTAPLYNMYTAAECRAAYARAKTRQDSTAVDFRPYAHPERRGRNTRCKELRGTFTDSLTVIGAR